MSAPVVLVAFNRPDLLRQTLERVRAAAPTEVFLIVDGPRDGNATDAAACAETRAVLDTIDWPCTVHRRVAQSNLGLVANIELGLDWVFGLTDRAIVLEDDCVADPSFFDFCTELLDRYADQPAISFIGGSHPNVPDAVFGGSSYSFASFASIWGWATWRRAWQAHRAVFPRDHSEGNSSSVRTTPIDWDDTLLTTRRGRQFFKSIGPVLDRTGGSWAIHWCLSNIACQSLAISPATNLVANAGLGVGGTHTRTPRAPVVAQPLPFPLRHPESIAINEQLERELERLVVHELGGVARFARKVIPSGRLRTTARRLGTAWVRLRHRSVYGARQVPRTPGPARQ